MSAEGNGRPTTDARTVDTLVLTYDRVRDTLEIGGSVNSLDLLLDMLYRAKRQTEFQQRKAQALEIQKAAREAAENERIAAALRNGR